MIDISIKNALKPKDPDIKLNYWADLVALAAGTIAFITGLVLLAEFHVGAGSLRDAALGLTRLSWVNLHRFSAVAALPAIALHIGLHWRVIMTRVRRSVWGLPGKTKADLVLYFGFVAVLLTGFIAWLIVPGSPPLRGPVALKHLAPARHVCIDLHHISGLSLLPAAVIHVRRHMVWMIRTTNRWIRKLEAAIESQ